MNRSCVNPFHTCLFVPVYSISLLQNMATSSTPKTEKTLDPKVSIWLFQLPFLQQCISSGCVCCLRILDKWVLSSLLVSADNKKACSESRSCTQKPAAKEGEHQLLGNWNFSAVTFPSSWQLNNCQYAIGLYSAAWEQQAEACSDGTGHAASPFPGTLTTPVYFAFWPLTEHLN